MTDWEVRANLVQLVTLPWAAGSQIFFSSPTLRPTELFFGVDYNRETIKGQSAIQYILRYSFASISEELMGREASVMSVSPAQNF